VRFLVVGAGAIGGVIGGRLLEAAYDVTAVARGAHLQALRERGLRLESPDGVRTLPLPVVASPAEHVWSDDDVVVLAVKSQDTEAALRALAAVAPASVLVVCAQNGVANERAALRLFPEVVGMCVMCPSAHLEPGVVQAYAAPTTGLLDVGLYPRGTDGRVEQLAAALRRATFASEARDDIMR
jgi:2-dehydropantoate 2-reductase